MRYWQDLQDVGQDEKARMDFVFEAIEVYKGTDKYKKAAIAKKYYKGEDITINLVKKWIYDSITGQPKENIFAANNKLSTNFFGFVVDQAASYLLGNGVTFGNEATKDKLGPDFDIKMMKAAIACLWGGASYNFWNNDHVEVFEATEFVPLEDEDYGVLMAGIRFWQLDNDRPLRATLYEPDGVTEYIKRKDTGAEVLAEKRPYKITSFVYSNGAADVLSRENYIALPIIPMRNNEDEESELEGKRATVDAYDLCTSNMVNGVQEGNVVYWLLKNCGGMTPEDCAEFIYNTYMNHVVTADGGADSTAEPRTIESPFQGTQATIDMLTHKLYMDFQAFDASAVSAGNQTATAIRACYAPLDLKTNKFETRVTECILGLLKIAGLSDKPSYTRNQLINPGEETQNILMGAEYYSREYVTKKLLTINGDIDQYDEIMKQLEEEEMERMDGFGGADDEQADQQPKQE